MTETDELRRMLDERGVEYYRHEDDEPLRELKEGTDRATSWRLDEASCTVVECVGGTLDIWIDNATPAQAVEATLGRGECHVEEDEDTGFLCCSECGAIQPEDYTVYYCWCCGAKVVSE